MIREALTCATRLRGEPAALGQLRRSLKRFLSQADSSAAAQREQQFGFIQRMRADAEIASAADLGSRLVALLDE